MSTHQQLLEQKFQQAYDKLNIQQQEAVNTLEGPVMVIAGPGTGKTQILAARIAKILLETDARPENILCLTYTDAGTIAMRRRLQQFIGADAYQVNIYTFHAFCNDVIQDHLSLFEKSTLDPISEIEQVQLYKELIDTLPKNHLLKRYRGDVYFEINNLRQLFSTMKREGWSVSFIEEKINSYLNDLPLRDEYIAKRATKEFKKGDLRTDKIAEEQEKMEKLRAAALLFDTYQELMRKRNRYDFDDMINWVIRVFEKSKNQPGSVLAAYQEKFQYILVDEYQDTSGTQNKIVSLLISYWDAPNVFVVGDDDQSIYRFQGANIENMLDFAMAYTASLKTIVLTQNYRSTQPILDWSKTLINRNNERLVKQIDGLSKNLVAAAPDKAALNQSPQLLEYRTPREEMIGITESVQQLLANGTAPGRIAIIYKENKYGTELAEYFRLQQIPFYTKREVNILQQPFIRKILLLLRFIHAEWDTPYGGDEMLFEILHFDFYKIPPLETARLVVAYNEQRNNGETLSLRKWLSDKANEPVKTLFDNSLHPGLKNVSALLEQLIADVPNYTLLQFFGKLIEKAGVIAYVLQHPQKIELLQLLTALNDFIREEAARNPLLKLKELIDLLDIMEREDLPVAMNQVTGSDQGVNLLTAHGSKGLEFEHVFLAGSNAAFWEKKRKPGGGYKYPDTLFSSQPGSAALEELRRLFYVAITRAEKHLYISYARYRNDGKELEPSVFIAEIQQEQHFPATAISLSPEQLAQYAALVFLPQAPEIGQAEEHLISQLLQKFVMNVTALNNYLDCPLGFYYKNLIRIPTGKSEATEFGSAIHHALEKFFRTMTEDPGKQFPALDYLLQEFSWYMKRHREHFTREGYDRRFEYGMEVLKQYHNKYIQQWNKVVTVERNIRGVVMDEIPLKGKLDKLEFDGNQVNVVDYKSGDIDKALVKMKAPDDKNPNGGDYWRQAVFYKILIDRYNTKSWNVVSTEFDYVEPDKNKEYRKVKINIRPEDLETVRRQIHHAWERIQARDFYTGCGKEDCHWCNFVKDNNLAETLHLLQEDDSEPL